MAEEEKNKMTVDRGNKIIRHMRVILSAVGNRTVNSLLDCLTLESSLFAPPP